MKRPLLPSKLEPLDSHGGRELFPLISTCTLWRVCVCVYTHTHINTVHKLLYHLMLKTWAKMHLFVVLKVIQERAFCKYVYIIWLNTVHPFNGYCAPTENAHHAYLSKCAIHVVKEEAVGEFLENHRLTNIPTYVCIKESERVFTYATTAFLSGRWDLEQSCFLFCISVVPDFFTVSMKYLYNFFRE